MKTILVLEDEYPVLRLLHQVLKRHGYTTREASNAADAIRHVIESDRRIDLFLADVTLPVSSGIQVALLLRAELPDLKVILMSGYPAATWKPRDAADLERLGTNSLIVLQKPFEPKELLNCIRGLTEAPLSAHG